MAVDFLLLPSELPEPDEPPSRLVWLVVFLLLVLVGVFIVLLAWPHKRSTQSLDFWATVILFPIGFPALVVLLRFQHYVSRKQDIELSNKATRQYNERVFALASVPLAVAGVSHRFSVTESENAVATIRSGVLRLTVQELFARDSEPMKVRWLDTRGVKLSAGTDEDDRKRQIEVTRWLFGEMLAELAGAIRAVPSQVSLEVQLLLSGMLSDEQNQALWQTNWTSCKLRPAHVSVNTDETASLQRLDIWLDQVARKRNQAARLIVAIQLHPLLNGSPPKGAAEAGAAVLLIPDALANHYKCDRIANLHRPVQSMFDRSSEALMHALKWASSTSGEVREVWQTGLSLQQSGTVHMSAVKAGLNAQIVDLDARVGHTGIAAPWLAIACAARSLRADAPRQFLFSGHAQGVECAVLRDVSNEYAVADSTEGFHAPGDTKEPLEGSL